ncbi:hypothetical protein NDU88_007549 [Pleurodeles waltl]|uniref:Uncharacterized protein n=1 Tax=Pleurodeles waltl TaxID=8319 RepID=A0AAV7U404_PLEWA|nr:hypothetical protein NDU88_007549 [Pleurodeles waltl]
MQFLDSSVQKKEKNPTSRDRPGSLLRSVTATSEPLHPPLPPEAESRGREREETGPSSAPTHRPTVSGRPAVWLAAPQLPPRPPQPFMPRGNTGLLGLILPGCSAMAVAAAVPSAPLRLP